MEIGPVLDADEELERRRRVVVVWHALEEAKGLELCNQTGDVDPEFDRRSVVTLAQHLGDPENTATAVAELPDFAGRVTEHDSTCPGPRVEDELTVGFNPVLLRHSPVPLVYHRFTCSEIDALLAQEESFAAALAGMTNPTFQTAYENQVVYIESASYSVVPEPSTRLLRAVAIATLLLRSRRPRRTRLTDS